jgi:hypothetical protein
MTITIADLKSMPAKTIFAQGEAIDGPLGINMTGSGKMLRWVAVRGGIWDWAIYVGRNTSSYEEIARTGDKVHDIATIKRLVPCDKEAMEMYRA